MASEVPKSTRLSGHASSLLCCHSPLSKPTLIATSGQDGRVCLFDLRNKDNVQRFECFGHEGVSSICFTPANSDVLYAAAGTSIYCIDIRLGSMGGAVMKYDYNSEEINQVALNQKASYLAAADDSGEIKVIDLHRHKLLKTLRGIHKNICSTVQFHPQRPWELMTGGLDAKIVKWDFCKGKPLKVVDQGLGVSQTMSSGQFCNPPFVHVLATPEGKLSGEAGRVMAVAKGDGVVEVCDLALENCQELRPQGMRFKYLDQDKKSKGKTVQPVETSDRADDTVEGHMSAVSCVTFARFSQSRSLVLSGSNDRSIKLWNWCQKSSEASSESSSTSKDRGPMLLSIDHKKKVNWICTAASSSENVFVADTSKILTVYTVI